MIITSLTLLSEMFKEYADEVGVRVHLDQSLL